MSKTKPEENQEEIQEEETKLFPEEYAKARAAAIDHLKKEIVYLKVEKEYETLIADVEEAKTRGITMIAQRAQFFARQNQAQAQQQAGPGAEPEAQSEVPAGAPKTTRPLKTD